MKAVREFLMVTWVIQKAAESAQAAAEAAKRITALRIGATRKTGSPTRPPPVTATRSATTGTRGPAREDRIFLRLVYARLVVAQPVLMQASEAGHLSLRQAILIKHRDDEPKITPRACVEHVLACADPLTTCASQRKPEPRRASRCLGHSPASEVLRVSLSVQELIRPLQEHGSPQGVSNRWPPQAQRPARSIAALPATSWQHDYPLGFVPVIPGPG